MKEFAPDQTVCTMPCARPLDLGIGLRPDPGHILDLLYGRRGVFPRASDDVESFHGEVCGGGFGAIVVPVANHDVLRDQVDGAVGVVEAALPFAEAGHFTVQEAVAPDPELAVLGGEVIADPSHFAGEKLRFIFARTARAFVVAEVEHLVHAGMKRVGLEGFADFVHEREHDRVDLGMQGAIAFAVESVRVGPSVIFGLHPRGFVELRVDPEQVAEATGPGLVSQ